MPPPSRSEPTPLFRSSLPRSRRVLAAAAVGGIVVVGAVPAPRLLSTVNAGPDLAVTIGERSDAVPVATASPVEDATERSDAVRPVDPDRVEFAASSIEIQGTFADEVEVPEDEAATAFVDPTAAGPDAAADGEDAPLVYEAADGETIDAGRLRVWLEGRRSPLADHAEDLVAAGVEHGVDPRLVVGIAAIESSAGLRLPPGTHNAWGWSGGGPHGLKAWPSWPEAIHDFTERLARLYDTDNVDERLARKYVPPNWEKWLYTVRWVMDDI